LRRSSARNAPKVAAESTSASATGEIGADPGHTVHPKSVSERVESIHPYAALSMIPNTSRSSPAAASAAPPTSGR
jgi:hypothetical protein